MLIEVLFIKAENKINSHVHQLMKVYVHTHTHTVWKFTQQKNEQKCLGEYQDNFAEWRIVDKKIIYTLSLYLCNSKSRQTPVIKVKSVVIWRWTSEWIWKVIGGNFLMLSYILIALHIDCSHIYTTVWNSVRLYFSGLQNHCRWWLQPWN